jgi:hypothetical protein
MGLSRHGDSDGSADRGELFLSDLRRFQRDKWSLWGTNGAEDKLYSIYKGPLVRLKANL